MVLSPLQRTHASRKTNVRLAFTAGADHPTETIQILSRLFGIRLSLRFSRENRHEREISRPVCKLVTDRPKKTFFFRSISDLDMTPYCSSSTDASQSRYDLFGVINHRGSAWFGHYTSHARLLGYNDSAKTEIGTRREKTKKKNHFDLILGWRNCDDEYVTSLANEKELNRPDAYVLFYRHRHSPIHLNLPTPPSQPAPTTTATTTFNPHDTFEEPISMETNTLDDIRDLLS